VSEVEPSRAKSPVLSAIEGRGAKPPVLSHVEGKGAHHARREDGEYPLPIFNRVGWAKPSPLRFAEPGRSGDRRAIRQPADRMGCNDPRIPTYLQPALSEVEVWDGTVVSVRMY
jgi:hypothetical protein